MNNKTNSAKDLDIKVKPRVDQVNPDNHKPKVPAHQHPPGPVEFPDDLARFMAYAG